MRGSCWLPDTRTPSHLRWTAAHSKAISAVADFSCLAMANSACHMPHAASRPTVSLCHSNVNVRGPTHRVYSGSTCRKLTIFLSQTACHGKACLEIRSMLNYNVFRRVTGWNYSISGLYTIRTYSSYVLLLIRKDNTCSVQSSSVELCAEFGGGRRLGSLDSTLSPI